jgi:hypothetical protein
LAVTQATHDHNRFHNYSGAALADLLGAADAVLKGAEAECKSIKDEIRKRGVADLVGEKFTVTVRAQFTKRLDVERVRSFLGDTAAEFEAVSAVQTIRIKAAIQPLANAA